MQAALNSNILDVFFIFSIYWKTRSATNAKGDYCNSENYTYLHHFNQIHCFMNLAVLLCPPTILFLF